MGMSSRVSSFSRNASSVSRTCSMMRSRFMISMFFSAIAHMTGWPPNVIPCVNMDVPDANGSNTLSVVMTAPIDAYADDRPLADVTMSGLMSYLADPNQSPSRPKAQMTSSAQSRIPYLSQIARTPGQ